MQTYSAKPSEVEKKWLIIDAEGVVLGRLASQVAKLLRGKHKTIFTPHIDTGDHVVIVNAGKVKLTGRKLKNKVYYRHTGYPGGIKTATPEFILNGAHPERVIEKAVERMMPKESPLARQQLSKLRVYAGSDHPHMAQKAEVYDFAKMNPKNKR
ncbi:MAG: 50S ribosomal protein L13 [Pseudomonadota bacterium]|nr:50S ribosomal protein L13 [Pseudomonadota bacterium]MDE3037489.1 50S ribosomal protein L13 [Pseudomonadota bacterium]